MEDFATKAELESLRGIISDVASEVRTRARDSQQATAAVAQPSAPSFKWVCECLDVGGTAGTVVPTSSTLWSSYFDSPTVDKYTFHLPTDSGDLVPASTRGLDGEYRYSLSFNSSIQCSITAFLTYYTDSVAGKVQLVVNGSIAHNADFAGSTIIGEAVTINIKQGPNLISVAVDIFVDEVALFTNAFLTKGFSTPP